MTHCTVQAGRLYGPSGVSDAVVEWGLVSSLSDGSAGRSVEAVRGYRSWRWYTQDGSITLMSVNSDTPWPQDRELESVCECHAEHTCGIYAWNLPMSPDRWRWERADLSFGIVGEVDLWGEVHFHEKGYRAQFARPAAFYVSSSFPDRVSRLVGLAAIQYGVPLVRRGAHPDWLEVTS